MLLDDSANVVVMGGLVGRPAQVPREAVSVKPRWAAPEMTGGDVFTGSPAVTTGVRADRAWERPVALRAVTCTRMTDPTSAFLTKWVCSCPAPTQLEPLGAHRSQR